MNRRVLALAAAWAFAAQGVAGGALQQPEVRSELLVSTAWMAEHLNDPKVVLLHASSNRDDYAAAHIPGARFLDIDSIVLNAPPGGVLPPAERIRKAFEAVGVSDDTRIVLYTPDARYTATRAWYTLEYIGHGDHAALLDGGIEQWMKEKRPLSTGAAGRATGRLTLRVRPQIVATAQDVARASASGDAVLLDSRPMYRYRAGHVAGAAPLYWEKTLVSQEEPLLRDPAALRALFSGAGAQPGSRVITYCEIGFQATFTYFVARYLGLDARMYDGSMNDWRGQKKQPVVRGDERR